MTSIIQCRVYRCSKQDEMYIYLREDFPQEDIPEALLSRLGQLTEVMQLKLTADRKLARVDVTEVMKKLQQDGFFLQMPPAGQLNTKLHFGD